MRCLFSLVLPACLLCVLPVLRAQSAADLQTLADLKTASRQMQLESEGATPFRMEATFETADFLGRPDNQGRWTEEFAKPEYLRRTIRDSNSPENYAPEDQADIGVPAPTMSGTFMQRLLIDALLRPGMSDQVLGQSKVTYKTEKVGAVSLRCVILEPLKKADNVYLKRVMTRAYCLSADRPVIRLTQLAFGINVAYNSIAHFGDRTFAQQITASERGHDRGKLQITKLVAAPGLLQANLPKWNQAPPDDAGDTGASQTGAVRTDAKIQAGSILKKVTPVYPLEAKQKHMSGSVFLHAIISKEGTVSSLEVISAPADTLAEAAVEAVSQWQYKPYLVNGKPTEVDTTITVNFQFG